MLYLKGVMLCDKQMKITGIVMAIASSTISRAKLLKKLSPQRPETFVFLPGYSCIFWGSLVCIS